MQNLLEKILELVKGIQALPAPVKQEPNFFTIGGSGYFENPTSDLLAIFMGGQKNTPTWLTKALVHCLAEQGHFSEDSLNRCEWDEFIVEREVSINDNQTNTNKRLDLLITGAEFVLGIEHKVYAGAANNPFHVYDQLLQQRADGKQIIKCVLRPNKYSADVPSDWPVVSYDELIAKAKLFYGSDIAFSPISKWQFFYAEFLQHLHALAHPESENPMDKESFDFVNQHFNTLRKGYDLLVDFEHQLLHQGRTYISKALQELNVEDSTITHRIHTWEDSKALRFQPKCWGGWSSVVLAYFGDEDNVEQPVQFYIRAYIEKGTEKVDFETISKELSRVTSERLDMWEDDKHESEHCWQESGGKYLCFGAYAKDRTLDGTLKALASLTKWLQLNAYTEIKTN